jgi:hypothetical protein
VNRPDSQLQGSKDLAIRVSNTVQIARAGAGLFISVVPALQLPTSRESKFVAKLDVGQSPDATPHDDIARHAFALKFNAKKTCNQLEATTHGAGCG